MEVPPVESCVCIALLTLSAASDVVYAYHDTMISSDLKGSFLIVASHIVAEFCCLDGIVAHLCFG